MDKLLCFVCEKEGPKGNFYTSHSILYRIRQGRTIICKSCLEEIIQETSEEARRKSLMKILVLLDKPFLHNVYEASFNNKSSPSVIRCYLKNISMKQYRDLTYTDSVFEDEEEKKEKVKQEFDNSIPLSEDSIQITDEIRFKFGYGFTDHEYMRMERYANQLELKYVIDTPTAEDAVITIAKLSVMRDRLLADGEWGDLDKVSKNIIQLQQSAGLRPIDKKSVTDANGINGFGTLTKRIEQDGWIEPPKLETTQDIVDDLCFHFQNFTLSLLDRPEMVSPPKDTPKVSDE